MTHLPLAFISFSQCLRTIVPARSIPLKGSSMITMSLSLLTIYFHFFFRPFFSIYEVRISTDNPEPNGLIAVEGRRIIVEYAEGYLLCSKLVFPIYLKK